MVETSPNRFALFIDSIKKRWWLWVVFVVFGHVIDERFVTWANQQIDNGTTPVKTHLLLWVALLASVPGGFIFGIWLLVLLFMAVHSYFSKTVIVPSSPRSELRPGDMVALIDNLEPFYLTALQAISANEEMTESQLEAYLHEKGYPVPPNCLKEVSARTGLIDIDFKGRARIKKEFQASATVKLSKVTLGRSSELEFKNRVNALEIENRTLKHIPTPPSEPSPDSSPSKEPDYGRTGEALVEMFTSLTRPRTPEDKIKGLENEKDGLVKQLEECRQKWEDEVRKTVERGIRLYEFTLEHWGNERRPIVRKVVVRYTESVDQDLATKIVNLFPAPAWSASRIDARGMDLENPSSEARIVLEAYDPGMASDLAGALCHQYPLGEEIRGVQYIDPSEADVTVTIYHAKRSSEGIADLL